MPEGIQGLDVSTVNMMTGAMTLNQVPLKEIYTPMSKVTILHLDTKIDAHTVKKILDLGFSRIPVSLC